MILVELHNFFEAAGYNLIEAADVDEAVALGEMHEGRLDLVIAGARQAGEVLRHLSGPHPWLKALCILEDPGVGNLPPDQIGRPFTERELLDKVERLLNGTEAAPAAAGVLTS